MDAHGESMAATQVATQDVSTTNDPGILARYQAAMLAFLATLRTEWSFAAAFDAARRAAVSPTAGVLDADLGHELSKTAVAATHRQSMGAGQIVGMGISIGIGGVVLNQLSGLDIVANSTGVVDVSSIFSTAGQGLILLSIAILVGAAAVILGFFGGGGGF
jgi:hypothetical protein